MNTQQFLVSAWNWDPLPLAICCVVAASFGWLHVRNGHTPTLLAGLVVLLLALLSPLATLARGYIFSAHMAQHILLLLVVPPLLLLSLPLNCGARAEHGAGAERAFLLSPVVDKLGRFLRATGAGWAAGVGAMWVWHLPNLCNAAASSPAVYAVQTITLLLLGILFWWPVAGPRDEHRLGPFSGIAYLVTACFACTLLGIYITFTPVTVCPVFASPSDRLGLLPLIRDGWGLTPATDQAIGGLMMWVPACLIYLSGVITLLARWYASAEIPATSGQP